MISHNAGGRSAAIAALLLGAAWPCAAAAQDAGPAPSAEAEDIIVTATKRAENLQRVPLSIQAIGEERLDQLQVSDFEDYVKFLPSVTFQTAAPGFAKVYFRGVASGENANHSASLPTVGIYLDEQPITTIQGALDIHIYDVARVEALAGPQGTLYGASSQAGTIRIITNKPDPGQFEGGADAEINKFSGGEVGYTLEGFLNVPLTSNIAVRGVGYYVQDGGYIDNLQGFRTYPTSGIIQSNRALARRDYNDVETVGGRLALGVDLDDRWTVTGSLVGQITEADGSFAQQRGQGRWKTQQFNPEGGRDEWFQAALTVEGRIGNWDLTYAGAYLKRKVDGESDYSDYSYFYDALFGYGAYYQDNAGNLVSPNQYIQFTDRFTKQSHELRLASPQENRLRAIVGLFYQRQTHNIEQNYIIDNIADAITVTGTDSNIWLTKQFRVDRDYAAFGEVTFDITDRLKALGGLRVYHYDNSLVGFFGYSAGFSSRTGEAVCFAPAKVGGSPCTNLDKSTKDTDFIHKLNLTYEFSDTALAYFTWSKGFRPGGINRRGELDPYGADELTNFELGWKSSWFDRRLRFNGAIYRQQWDNIQLSFLGANGLTEIRNAGNARINGVEFDLGWRQGGLTLSAGGSYNDAEITRDFCRIANPDFDCSAPADNQLLAPAGTRLPVTPRFKGNVVARYEMDVGPYATHVQAAAVHEGGRSSDLRDVQRAILGPLDGYTTLDLSAGVKRDGWSLELYVTNLTNSNGVINTGVQCVEVVCGDPEGVTASGGVFYDTVIRPRRFGARVGARF
jgi:outer membrane receptor protein involved in Fe transport